MSEKTKKLDKSDVHETNIIVNHKYKGVNQEKEVLLMSFSYHCDKDGGLSDIFDKILLPFYEKHYKNLGKSKSLQTTFYRLVFTVINESQTFYNWNETTNEYLSKEIFKAFSTIFEGKTYLCQDYIIWGILHKLGYSTVFIPEGIGIKV